MKLFTWLRRKRKGKEVLYHSDGVPVGMRPGDPIPPQNIQAIWDFIQQHGQPIADKLEPGATWENGDDV